MVLEKIEFCLGRKLTIEDLQKINIVGDFETKQATRITKWEFDEPQPAIEELLSLEKPQELIDLEEQEKINSLKITQRQLRLWLLRNKNKSASDIKALLVDNEEALIEFEYASMFERKHPLFDEVGAMLEMTSDDLNQMFIEAKGI